MTFEEFTRTNLAQMGCNSEMIEKTIRDFREKFGPADLAHEMTEDEVKACILEHAMLAIELSLSPDPIAKANQIEEEANRNLEKFNKSN